MGANLTSLRTKMQKLFFLAYLGQNWIICVKRRPKWLTTYSTQSSNTGRFHQRKSSALWYLFPGGQAAAACFDKGEYYGRDKLCRNFEEWYQNLRKDGLSWEKRVESEEETWYKLKNTQLHNCMKHNTWHDRIVGHRRQTHIMRI